MLTGGKIGEFLAALAFASALVAMISAFMAELNRKNPSGASWARMAAGAFVAHAAGIFGMIITLFVLIYTHQYQYHYVWAHSSNELPVQYMISCFWEGQEGSFLLWNFWHSVLGLFFIRKSPWRTGVLAVLSAIELIITSMILGVFIPDGLVQVLLMIFAGGLTGFMAWKVWQNRQQLNLTYLAGALLGVAALVLFARNQHGFMDGLTFQNAFSTSGLPFTLFIVLFAAFALSSFFQNKPLNGKDWTPTAVMALGLVAIAAMYLEPGLIKFGSNPFLSLKEAFPDNEAYIENPDFVPTNGTGLNSLLQNYWMVIHPPTLFLGFAATAIPFAFAFAGFVRGEYKEWIKPALPWVSFSVMVLGIGIIMGGYWAYETLNFGGYWNWDPVENSSFVPWLVGVGSLHAMLIFQRKKTHLKLTTVLVMTTFLLVLYSTFLTRSGILGETSVHTFTDLGLSGQLLVLVGLFVVLVIDLLQKRWKELAGPEPESKVWTPEFFLLMGVLVFLFSAGEIILTTSLPAINKILGTHLAPPPRIQLFYYQWNVWFAIAFGVLSGIGQFLWWKIRKEKPLSESLFRPFVAAMVAGTATLLALAYAGKTFAFDAEFAKWNPLHWADELLLYASLFAFMANVDVLISLIRGNKKGLKVMGGTVVHIGFALMLVGMLFSSGFDEVVSKNIFPEELNAFSETEKVDNILLPKGFVRPTKNYFVEYVGKKEAAAPISDLEVLEANDFAFKIGFRDSTGERFGLVLPRETFNKKATSQRETTENVPVTDTHGADAGANELDLAYVETFLNRNMEFLKPMRLNNRILYGVKFSSPTDSTKHFTLYPEAEINEKEGSIIAHPNRKIYWNKDLYVHVSSVPAPEDAEPKYEYRDFAFKVGDTASIGSTRILLAQVTDLSSREEFKEFQVVAAARIIAFSGTDTFTASPVFLIDQNRQPSMVSASIEPLHLDFAFVGVEPEKGVVRIQAQVLTNPTDDYVVVKAIEKPFINLLWLGTFILTFGFLISIYRRITEQRKGTVTA